jgi:hypothetical protein
VGVLTILVFVAAFLTALIVNAEMQRRFLASGQGFVRMQFGDSAPIETDQRSIQFAEPTGQVSII